MTCEYLGKTVRPNKRPVFLKGPSAFTNHDCHTGLVVSGLKQKGLATEQPRYSIG